jgi:hypothetical protein
VSSASQELTRASLAARTLELLNEGGLGNPDVLLVSGPDGARYIVKDFSPRPWWVRASVGRWITRREVRAYRALDGHPNVPRLICEIDPLAFAVEYRPGQRMSWATYVAVPAGFERALEDAVSGMHARGVAHLDLSHRSNVLVDSAHHPILIDFGSAVCFRPGGLGARLVLPWLARIDRRALRKWQRRVARARALIS